MLEATKVKAGSAPSDIRRASHRLLHAQPNLTHEPWICPPARLPIVETRSCGWLNGKGPLRLISHVIRGEDESMEHIGRICNEPSAQAPGKSQNKRFDIKGALTSYTGVLVRCTIALCEPGRKVSRRLRKASENISSFYQRRSVYISDPPTPIAKLVSYLGREIHLIVSE